MKCLIYVNQMVKPNFHIQHNICARYAARFGYSVEKRVIDFEGNRFFATIDKVIYDNEINCLIVYNMNCIGNYETVMFYRDYLAKHNKKLIFCT